MVAGHLIEAPYGCKTFDRGTLWLQDGLQAGS